MGYIFDAMERSDAAGRLTTAGVPEAGLPTDAPAAPLPENLGLPGLADGGSENPHLRMTGSATSTSVTPAPDLSAAPDILDVDDRLVALTEPSSVMAEEYRAIRTGLLAQWQNKRHLIHTISSATPREGKTITSLNLGLSLAELADRRTVVVEADLRLPKFHNLLYCRPDPGLVDLLEGRCQLAQALRTVGPGHLSVITAGRPVGDRAVQTLSSEAMLILLKDLRRRFDHVIIDTPPVLELADAGILGAWSDEVLLVARMNLTPQPLVTQAIRTLASYNAPVTGLIATDHQRPSRHYSRHGYYRYYRQSRAEAA